MASLEDLERRVKLLEEERELRHLLARYSFNADLGRSQAYVDLYTEDGAIDLGPGDARYEGHERLLKDFILGPGHKSIEGYCQHHTTGPLVFYIDGDTATAEGYSVVYVQREQGIEVFTAGFNRWTFQKVNGEWKIKERYRRPMGTPEQQGVITRTSR